MKDKLIAGTLILCTLGFFFYQATTLPKPSSTYFSELPLSESIKIFEELGGQAGAMPVVLFETDWCSVCKGVRGALEQQSIAFLPVDIEKNKQAFYAYDKLRAGRQGGVPLLLIGSKVVLGFRLSQIDQAYKELSSTYASGVSIE